MKPVSFAVFFVFALSTALCQDKDTSIVFPKYKLSFTYGLTSRNSENKNIDFHMKDDYGNSFSNNSFTLTSEVPMSKRELLITFTMRPLDDNKLMILRGGLLQAKYRFIYAGPETENNSTPIGKFIDAVTETYSIYPFSIGGGYSTPVPYLQIHVEAIVALGHVKEEDALTMSTGEKSIATRSFHAETIGFRFGVQLNPQLSNLIGLHIEGGYRLLGFGEFFDDATGESIPLDFSTTGWYFNGGVAVAL